MTFAIVTTLIIVLVASARYLTYALVGYLDYFLANSEAIRPRIPK